jgi:predicted amidohydrolase YtcJ
MTALVLGTALLVVPGPHLLDAPPPTGVADLILHGGHVLTMLEPEPDPAPTALACRDGRILLVGDDAAVLALRGPRTEVVDLAGAVAMPGLVDSHAHLYGIGKALAEIDLMGTADAAECAARVTEAAATRPDGWLQGRGWDQNDWPDRAWPHRALLDATVGARPVLLRRVDGHAAWASSEALRLAGIDRDTPDPAGGAILRDGDGEPTGILVDNAVDLVRAVIPAPDAAEIRRRIDLAVGHCLARGLTGLHEMGATWERARIYRAMHEAGELDLRLHVFLDDLPDALEAGFAAGPFTAADRMLQIRSVKLYADGALGSRGALLLGDYSDDPGNRGLAVTGAGHLRDVCERARDLGWQVGAHAIGDAANRLLLDVFADVLGEGAAARDARWRIEHAQIVHPDDLPRFARQGVVAAMQPVHCTSDMDWAEERLGPDRLDGAYAWRTLTHSGAAVCFGTDAPVESVDPLAGLYAARTRMHQDGTPPGGWRAQECVDARTAVRLYTLGSAYAAFLEGEAGVLAPGRLADVTVLSGDPTAADAAAVLTLRPLLTIVGGAVRWRAP